jgi:hypothetical protein
MRNYRLATIGKHTITAFELSVAQVLSLYFAAGDLKIDDEADAEKFDVVLLRRLLNDGDFLKVSGKLNDKEMATALEFWKETNKSIFNPENKSGGKKFLTFKHLYKSVCESVAVTIRNGHVNALDYAWSFYLIAIAAIEKEGKK